MMTLRSSSLTASSRSPSTSRELAHAEVSVSVREATSAHITHLGESGAGPLQRAVDRRDRSPRLCGDVGGAELQYLAEQQHRPLTCRQGLHRRHHRQPHVGPRLNIQPRVGKRL